MNEIFNASNRKLKDFLYVVSQKGELINWSQFWDLVHIAQGSDLFFEEDKHE